MEEKKKDIQKDSLKPITKVNSKLDKELQEWEVESTTSGGWGEKPKNQKSPHEYLPPVKVLSMI